MCAKAGWGPRRLDAAFTAFPEDSSRMRPTVPPGNGTDSALAGTELIRSMKIALLSFEYPSETGFGGIGTYAWYHARALVKLGHQVHVLAGATAPTARTCT